ncbi:hypothetical protein F5Y19DRAFT_395628 [Xylariaceae sp. FL1651]|nr:hypothetical protein F5Y19DRAFT_395628 [Xylariaceae sp. FL1651]
MAAAHDFARKGKSGRRSWGRSGFSRIVHRFPRGTREQLHRWTRCGTSEDKFHKQREPPIDGDKSCNPALDQTRLAIGEPPVQERAPTSPSSAYSPTQSKPDATDKPRLTEPARPYPRTQSRTFPQSYMEKERFPVVMQSIDARIGEDSKESKDIANVADEAKYRHQLPVSEGFQDIDRLKKKLYGGPTSDTEMQALQLQLMAIHRTQIGPQGLQDSKRFVQIWESKLLPKLEQILDENVEGEYTVNVLRGPEAGQRDIVIMVPMSMSNKTERQLQESKSKVLPGDLDSKTTMTFHQGSIQFLTNPGSSLSRASSRSSDDPCTDPVNVDWSPEPAMGDSVGWNSEKATLGPMLQINKKFYRLLCWHLFDDENGNRHWDQAQPPPNLSTFHPSSDSRQDNRTRIGDVVAYSGPMYKTSRASVSIGQDRQEQTVTDWALVESVETGEMTPQPNKVRRQLDLHSPFISEIEIIQAEDPQSFARACDNQSRPQLVYSIGRTSGNTVGRLCETPGSHRLQNGTKTKNWYTENLDPSSKQVVDDWIRGGMGVPGDSGAGVFGFYENQLLGQVWGRNIYKGSKSEPRVTYFTAIPDIYADIREKMPACTSVQLPTGASIRTSMRPEPDLDVLHTTLGIGEHSGLSAISEELKATDLEDMDDHRLERRSRARMERFGMVIALGKKASLADDRQGCQPLHKWAKAIMHAATF